MRVTPDIEGGSNGGLACKQGKFELADEAYHEARLINAMIRDANGALEAATWDDAITAAADGLLDRGDAAAVVISPGVANEDAWVLNRLARENLQTQRIAMASNAPINAGREVAAIFGPAQRELNLRSCAAYSARCWTPILCMMNSLKNR